MERLTDKKKCTGCQVCRLICPEKCVEFKEDGEGFLSPVTDESRCTRCRLCAERCPENGRPARENKIFAVKVYGVKNKNAAQLKTSASGGVFSGMAHAILKNPGGAVFGCGYDETFTARHMCVTDAQQIARLQSSKYVQSDVGDSYARVKSLLEDNKTVFFTGTPCQVAGLYKFLDADHKNLLTADLICHGVPSPLLFKKYLKRLEIKYCGKLTGYNFRAKERDGWGLTAEIEIINKKKYVKPQIDPYYNGFINAGAFRECCYVCRYANGRRAADLTFGDYWGVKNHHPEFYDKNGVSVVLVNTPKGAAYFEAYADRFEIVETTFEKAAARNGNLSEPTPRPATRDTAYDGMKNETADVFKNPAYKIKTSSYAKEFVRMITPPPLFKAYKKIKRAFIKNFTR